MVNKNYILLIWDEGGIPHVQGLYPNNEQTFNYLKALLLEDVQEWNEEILSVPDVVTNVDELSDWYCDQTNDANEFWRVEPISPQDAPQVSK